MKKETVKVPIGMRHSWAYPITEEPETGHPKYGPKIDMGAAVKGYMSITTVAFEIPGDDVIQADADQFVSAQLDVETTLSDLEINAKIFGHTYAEESGELSSRDDTPPKIGYAYVEPLLKSDKTIVYRATCLYKTSALASSEKSEADTRKSGELTPKMNALSLKAVADNSGGWRHRKEFPTLTEADAWIDTIFPNAAAAAASVPHQG